MVGVGVGVLVSEEGQNRLGSFFLCFVFGSLPETMDGSRVTVGVVSNAVTGTLAVAALSPVGTSSAHDL